MYGNQISNISYSPENVVLSSIPANDLLLSTDICSFTSSVAESAPNTATTTGYFKIDG
jgi:hypothetical protein